MTPRLVHSAGPVPPRDPARPPFAVSGHILTADALAVVTLRAPAGREGRAIAWRHLMDLHGRRVRQLGLLAAERQQQRRRAALRTALPGGDAA